MVRKIVLAALAITAATPVLAHTGVGATHGFEYGFMHPIGGMDHVLAMVAVGLFAALLSGRALWAVPAAFVGMMLVGFGLGVAGIEVPAVEFGIAGSVVAIGAAVAFGAQWPVAAAMAFVGAFAVFHGYAHGLEMPLDATGAEYAAGFAIATALLHAAGLGVGLATRARPIALRAGGAAVAALGLAIMLT
jgi:urease accessory protein